MDGNTLQAKIYGGYAKAATRIGLSFAQYRPTSATNPLATSLGSLLASFNAQDWTYKKPQGYGKAVWYCVADGTQLAVGDYLVGAPGTFFIASMQPALPIQAVLCNRTVTLYRPQQEASTGIGAYGGNTAQNQTVLAQGFPASVLQGSKSESSVARLPGDPRQGWWNMLLPPLPGGVLINYADVVTDDIGKRYLVSSAEQTSMGWRMAVTEAET
ncbi:hypothetical protein ISN76_12930 [Dyella halodurans]|uniref:Uncharacterized protein n=1 Tax=Dyella halodurans TaxID=1920171 RepID=A0ABV9C0F2_9GAMM|nr:hypothetical protein [Dyella halodurans]